MPLDFPSPGSEEWNRLVLAYDPFEGDYGDGSERTLCDEIRIVKRRGKCRECVQPVERGTFARTIKKADSEGFYGGRICQECCSCMAKVTMYLECDDEDDIDPYEELAARYLLNTSANQEPPMPLDLDEIRRRWATTPWTNGRSPELAADIAAMLSELDRLRSELAAAQAAPVVEWCTRIDVEEATVGAFALLVESDGWRLEVSDGTGDYWIVDSGDETGPAGKSAAEAAYRRACGFPTAPPCAG